MLVAMALFLIFEVKILFWLTHGKKEESKIWFFKGIRSGFTIIHFKKCFTFTSGFLCVVTGQDESIKPSALKSECTGFYNEAIEFVLFYCIVIVMVHSIVLLLIFGGVVPCCISAAPSVRGNCTELFRGYSLEQRIAYRIGQVDMSQVTTRQ